MHKTGCFDTTRAFSFIFFGLWLSVCLFSAPAVRGDTGEPMEAHAEEDSWNEILRRAEGQTVFWNAWGGSPKINSYISWASSVVRERFGIDLRHVGIKDTGHAVARVLAEKQAGRQRNGSVDLVWINGENFASMKKNGLLYGPWTHRLPSGRLIDLRSEALSSDFSIPVAGMEAPWGLSRLVFFYDRAHLQDPPRSLQALLDWCRDHPGRFTYPRPPDYLGTTFLKQVLLTFAPDVGVLQKPVDEADFSEVSANMWAYLDALAPFLWRHSEVFPESWVMLQRLLADREIDIAFAFDPAAASAAIAEGTWPASVRSFTLRNGTIGNAHFLAIPFNSSAREGAMVVVNFLLSPEAQARKQDPVYWGNLTVLDFGRLSEADRRVFLRIAPDPATLSPEALGPTLPEPHASWVEAIEEEWERRYGS